MSYLNKKSPKKIFNFLFFSDKKKFFSNTQVITLLALLLALRLIMQFFSIYIPQFSMSISIAWIPIIMIGWVFGPIVGFVVGGIADTIAYLIQPTQAWFWMYAIQEPLVGFLAGIISFIYRQRINALEKPFIVAHKRKFIFDIVLFNLLIVSFLCITLTSIFYWTNGNFRFQGSSDLEEIGFFRSYKYILLASFIFFIIIMEIFFIYFIKKKKDKPILLLIYISIIVIINAFLFSFILGPITSVEYFKFLNDGREPNSFIKYGTIYYLVPRVLKESIKSPIQIFSLLSLMPIINFAYEKIINSKKIKW